LVVRATRILRLIGDSRWLSRLRRWLAAGLTRAGGRAHAGWRPAREEAGSVDGTRSMVPVAMISPAALPIPAALPAASALTLAS
jgi:hypothetical protein